MKKIKVLLMSLVLITCMLGANGTVAASSYSSGKAFIPYYSQSDTLKTVYTVANITDSPITVTVTIYNADGTLVTDDNSSTTGRITASTDFLNYSDQNIDSSLTFTLNAHNTGYFIMNYNSAYNYGYGVINWTQNGTAVQGLVVTGKNISSSNNTLIHHYIPVNNGLPF